MIYERGQKVLVAWPSGHLEECTVEETVVWVKDASGHAHECTLGQLSLIRDEPLPQNVPLKEEK